MRRRATCPVTAARAASSMLSIPFRDIENTPSGSNKRGHFHIFSISGTALPPPAPMLGTEQGIDALTPVSYSYQEYNYQQSAR